jgi:hypothetical protein
VIVSGATVVSTSVASQNWFVGLLGLTLVSGCSSGDSKPSAQGAASGSSSGGTSSGSGSNPSPGGNGSSSGGNGSGDQAEGGSSSSDANAGSMTGTADGGAPAKAQACDMTMASTQLDADLVVPSGQTYCVGPGVIITATANITVQVEGVLIVDGTAASPAQFVGGGQPNSWHGIVVAAGGNLQLTYGTIRDAQYAIHTMPGSAFNIDYGDLGTSFKTAVLESGGKIDHTYFRASVPPTISAASEVTIDDPNGSMTILSASPAVSNSTFIGASPFTDLIRIGGDSSPVFDHVLVQNAHCGFHTYGATNNSPLVKNSVIEGLSYGVMAYTTKPMFQNCVFQNNSTDVGLCSGATSANEPVLTGDYFKTGKASIDPSCLQIGTAAMNSATSAITGAGPVGL